jgi:hypothetical protein
MVRGTIWDGSIAMNTGTASIDFRDTLLDADNHGFSSYSSLSDHNSVAASSAAASRFTQQVTLSCGANSLT